LENWCLHLDGKRIDNKEYHVLVLKSELKEVKLEALVLPNEKAETILNGITAITLVCVLKFFSCGQGFFKRLLNQFFALI